MNRSALETPLAWFSIASAIFQFLFETVYHLRFGQFLPMLIVDYIAVSLLFYGGAMSLRARPASAAGLICGAWGFTFCLAYRTFFWRLEDLLEGLGRRGAEPDALIFVLGVLLLISTAAFLFSFWLAHPGKESLRRAGAQRAVLLLVCFAAAASGRLLTSQAATNRSVAKTVTFNIADTR